MSADYLPVHDPSVHGPAYAVKQEGQNTGPFAAVHPYFQPVPTWNHAPSCGGCGHSFAGDPAALGTTPILAAAVDAGLLVAGWQQDGGTWTCTVCLAKASAPAPEPEPTPVEHEPAPDTDPYDQYHATSDELDARLTDWWDGNNQSNTTAHRKINARLHDAQVRIDELTGRAA